jgi:magnesium-transporting ATPase (P-type)
VAAWGFFLRAFTPKNERIKSCADVLIYSNLLMIAVNVFAMNRSPFIGLSLSMLCLVIGIAFIWMLPLGQENEQNKTFKNKTHGGIKNQLILLCFFVFIITINSGLMYQVINPAFEHLTGLVSWYWAVPYIVALVIMRNLPMKAKRVVATPTKIDNDKYAFRCFLLRLGFIGDEYKIARNVLLRYLTGNSAFRYGDQGRS